MTVHARTLAVAGALALAPLSGCGGGHATGAGTARGASSDRVAYYQLATAVGFLRASAASARLPGPVSDPARAQLPGAGQRLARLHPRDPRLETAARELRAAITRWLAASGLPARRRAARDALTLSDRVVAELQAFLRTHHALSGAIPD